MKAATLALLAAFPIFSAPATAVAQGTEAVSETPIVVRIEVDGNRRYTDRQLISALGQPIGEELDPDAIRRGVGVLWEVFRVRANVSERATEDATPDDGRGAVELLITVEELALDLEPRFIGNVSVDEDDLLEWARLGLEGELYLYQAERVRERILRGYREKGFYFAEVRVVDRPGGLDEETGEYVPPDVIFEIVEGPKVRVSDVVLDGADELAESRFWVFRSSVKQLGGVSLHGPRLFNWFASSFNEETLRADVIGLREVYRDYGFLDAIVEVRELEFSEDRRWVTIHIAIDKGEPYVVGSMGLEAYQWPDDPRGTATVVDLAIPEDELLSELDVQVGEVFRRNEQRADERLLRKRFGELGYIDHISLPSVDRWQFLEPALVFDPEKPIVHVTYRLHQGRQQFVREVRVSGNLHTEDRIIRRLVTVDPGDVADPTEINQSLRRIQGSGLFSNPRNPLGHREPTYRFVETDDPNWKDLELIVEEGEVLTFQLAGGVSSNTGAFGLFSVTHRNFDISRPPSSPWDLIGDVLDRTAFHGAGQELTLEASPGTERSYFRLLFREPDLFSSHRDRISLTLSAQSQVRGYRTHDEERREYGFRVGRQVGPDSSVYVGYTFGSIEVDDIDTGGEPLLSNPLAVPRSLRDQEGKNDLSFFEIGYRLRTTDNRISPRNGQTISFTARLYDEALVSDYEFIKTEFIWNWYDELGEEGIGVSDRIRIGLRGGVATPYGDYDYVPYTERFFLGGQRLLRGFDFRGVGPNRLDIPYGGETYLAATLEWRHPLVTTTQPGTYQELETFHAGLFIDAGVLDPDAFEIDWSETRASAGILFGLGVPIPITFSLGWPLKEGDGDDKQVLGFSIGI